MNRARHETIGEPLENAVDDGIAEATRELLVACGLDLSHKDLLETPQRVARFWRREFLSGYRMEPAEILADKVTGEGDTELVVIHDISYHGMCPHHLLPYHGSATVAYLPGASLVGFGRLNELVNCFTRRLTLQERACNEVVDALMEHLGARGAGCVMAGTHACLAIPDNKHGAQVLTSSFRGELRNRPDLQDRLMP